MPGGRPTKYDPEYCNKLIVHMSEGLSYSTFAALIKVNIDTLYEWEKHYPEFSEAKKDGYQACAMFWEKLGRSAAVGQLPGFNATAFVWMTKNMLGWRDKKDIQISGSGGGPIDYRDMTESELKRRTHETISDIQAFDALKANESKPSE